jgi:hypothetical protein
MNRLSTFVWILVITVASFMLYRVKYEVQSLRLQIAETSKQLRAEREAMNVVAAEWAYLNRPDRLQQLSSKYLSSTNVTVDQIAEVEAIPFPKKLEASAASNNNIKPVSAKLESAGGDDQ